MQKSLTELVCEKTGVAPIFVDNLITFYDEKATIPFVSRYRKDQTGNLDEIQVASAYDSIKLYNDLFDRKTFILEEIEKKGKLTDELRAKIENCYDPKKLEALYLPYKEKRKTKADKAKEAGLEPLAIILMGSDNQGKAIELAQNYINTEKGYDTPEKVLEGALYIVSQSVMETIDLMDYFVKSSFESGTLHATKKKGYDGADMRFEDYYEYSESLKNLQNPKSSHRYLAIKRGEECGALSLKTEVDEASHIFRVYEKFIKKEHFYKDELRDGCNIAYTNYLRNAIDTRITQELTEIAEQEAISVFAKNLESLFMAPPIPYRNVIGLDPGIRTGIKTAVLDKDGKFIENAVLYINSPLEKDQSALKLRSLIKKHKIGAVGVGTGTGSKEAFALAQAVAKAESADIITALVDEAGASVYSASEIAREEFPDLDLTVRGAISIGRRLQNPLAELVKVDPRSVGVGQYQHDVDQKKLKESLERVVQICVNNIGVDLNTASYSILTHISGLAEKVAKSIVEYREKNGMFKSREELKKVKGIGAKVYEQCAGFLRIRDGKNPLDNTRVHPESYETVALIAKDMSMNMSELIGNKTVISTLDIKKYLSDNLGEHTLKTIAEDLKHPARDPRKEFRNVKFLEGVDKIEDLKNDMLMEGRVTNVTNFGAFIDIGVHQDGLCHISQMGDRFIKDPSEVMKVGDIVKVKVIGVDIPKKRVSLKFTGK